MRKPLLVAGILVLAGGAVLTAYGLRLMGEQATGDAPESSRELCLGEWAFRRQSYDVALREFTARAPRDPRAQYHLGVMYGRGLGVAKNPRRALKWYFRAAEAGDREALFAIGLMFKEGRDIPDNHAESFRWLKQAAERGHVQAQFHTGDMYRDGRGVAQDKVRGLAWLMLAAEAGDPLALAAARALAEETGAAGQARILMSSLREQIAQAADNNNNLVASACK